MNDKERELLLTALCQITLALYHIHQHIDDHDALDIKSRVSKCCMVCESIRLAISAEQKMLGKELPTNHWPSKFKGE